MKHRSEAEIVLSSLLSPAGPHAAIQLLNAHEEVLGEKQYCIRVVDSRYCHYHFRCDRKGWYRNGKKKEDF